jgi:hypothetical protein
MRASEDVIVSLNLREKYKFGCYRCISMKLFDTKGGDFVENSDYSILVTAGSNNSNQSVLAEIPKEVPLLSGPDGFFKRIEIGVNNYEPERFRD